MTLQLRYRLRYMREQWIGREVLEERVAPDLLHRP